MLSFFRFLGDLKSVSSGYERLIATRSPPASRQKYLPVCHRQQKIPTFTGERPGVLKTEITADPFSYSLTAYHHHVVWVFVRRASALRKFTTKRGYSFRSISLARDGMHKMARWLVVGVGKSPLFTNCVDSEKTKRFRRTNAASVYYILSAAFAFVALCLPPGSTCAMCEFEVEVEAEVGR